jgi:hypothetical protein
MENPTTIAIDLSKNVFEIAIERQGRLPSDTWTVKWWCDRIPSASCATRW